MQVKKTALNLLLNTVGSSMVAFGVCAFIKPFGLIVGGATGISLVTNQLTGIDLSLITLIINLVVLIPGWILGGRKLVIGSVYSSVVYPLALAVFERLPGITAIADDILLAALCGGVVCGSGIGLVMHSGGSTGGTDIPALLLAKALRQPVNRMVTIFDTVIMLAQLFFNPFSAILYGLIYTFIMTRTLGTVVTFGEDRVRVTVVSEEYEAICRHLTENDFGVTLTFAEGGFTRTPIKKLESVMRSRSSRYAQKLIEEIDPTAFITVEKVRDVKGRGFTLERVPIELEE